MRTSPATILALALAVLPATAERSVDYERLILDQPNGYVDVSVLDLPPELLRRIADRSLRLDFRRQLRRTGEDAAWSGEVPVAASAPGIELRTPALEAANVRRWRGYPEEVPALRGFRAPIDGNVDDWPIDAPGEPAAYREAATFVATRLASDGLVRTVLLLLGRYPLPWVDATGGLDVRVLRRCGVPTDWLDQFTVGGDPLTDALRRWLGERERREIAESEQAAQTIERQARFAFRATRRGFVVLAEDGSEAVGGLRMQIAGHRPDFGPGDGSELDILHQLTRLDGLPRLTVSIESARLPALLGSLRSWGTPAGPPPLVVATPLPVSRWAQDNGKAGLAPDPERPGRRVPVTLVPRYANRNEQNSKFVPGDSFVFRALGDAATDVARSPLLFQGGDLLPIVEPAGGRRLLLVGEAEVQRNRALGLSREQVLEALRVEFGVDRVEVLPAVSYHIDLELTVRRTGDSLVAAVNDEIAASRIIAGEGIRALRRGGVLDERTERALLEALDNGRTLVAVAALAQITAPLRDATGGYDERFTAHFVRSAAESASGNALRFLLALDILTAASLSEEQLASPAQPLALRRYMQSLRRRAADRAALAERLAALGLRVVPIPSLSDEEASVNYVNGIQLPSRFLMPALGGFFEPLDAAARQALQRAFGKDVRIDAIRSAALQARYGGVHCALSAYPPAPAPASMEQSPDAGTGGAGGRYRPAGIPAGLGTSASR